MNFGEYETLGVRPVYTGNIKTDSTVQSDTEKYSLGRKIFEGALLILMNMTVVGALVNFEMLRGDKSWLKKEYERVFCDKEITVIKGSTAKSRKAKVKNVDGNASDGHNHRSNGSGGSGRGGSGIPEILPLTPEITPTNLMTTGQPKAPTDLATTGQEQIQPNPVIGQPVSVILPTDGGLPQIFPTENFMSDEGLRPPQLPKGVGFNLELVDLVIEVTGEMPTFQQPPLLEGGSGTPPLLEGGTPLRERSIVPVTQNTGVLSRLGSLIGSGMNAVFGEAPQPLLHVVGKFRAVVNNVECIYSVTVDTPLTGEVDPRQLIEQEMLRQLPPEVTRQHLPAIKHEGEKSGSGQIVSSLVEELTDEDEDDGELTIPRFITPQSMQSTGMQSRSVVESTQGLVQLPKAEKSSQDQVMMAARLASVSMLSQAVAFRLNNMPSQNLSHKIDNGVTLYHAVPTVGTFSWLAETSGMSAYMGFNPYGVGLAAVFAAMSGLWFSGRAKTKSFVHRETSESPAAANSMSEERKVAKEEPATQNQGWLEYIYGCFAYMASSVGNAMSYALPQNGRRNEPKYSEIHFGDNGSRVQFDLWETRNIGPNPSQRRRPNGQRPILFSAAMGWQMHNRFTGAYPYATASFVPQFDSLVHEHEQ